jgi:hypothetical protein
MYLPLSYVLASCRRWDWVPNGVSLSWCAGMALSNAWATSGGIAAGCGVADPI